MKYIDPSEFMKRLAAASGIDTLQLVKSPETMEQEAQQMQQQQMQASLMNQAGQLAKSPMADAMTEQMMQPQDGQQPNPEAPQEGPQA